MVYGIRSHRDIDRSQYREYRVCKGCNKRFEVKHAARLYCDECRSK